MQTITLRPRKIKSSLYKLHLKENINTNDFEKFEQNLKKLIADTVVAENSNQTEEHIKNLLQIFLEKTYYENRNYINTMSYKGQNGADLVIHSSKEHGSKVSVIIEAKKPKNKSEMPTYENIFKKAFFEAILYYLWEAVDKQNLEVKNIVITNIYEYFIFDARDIKRIFIDKFATLENTFKKWRANQLTDNKTDTMYQEIEKYINDHQELFDNFKFTYFDIRKVESDDLKYLYKIFSPKHLLREVLANDSNSLNKEFYNELLHIIGLEEVEKDNKKVIQKKKIPDTGSLLENTINVIDSKDKLESVTNISSFGEDKKEKIYNVSLSLCIGWVNRILFLKLLEGQLYKYHGFDKSYKFLDSDKINSFDKLNRLFFSVLAKKTEDRRADIQNDYFRIPYLNSSLFEMSQLENQAIDIGQLENNLAMPVYKNTVLNDNRAKKLKGELPNLKYLLDFLNSYDFGSEGENQLNQNNKTLINASVLGLIFEKINGYKDGSFYTPGFITTYMCRESIQRAVLQKFNDKYSWSCESIKDLYNKIDNIQEANEIVNSLKICDPAVGSGHFLVSALNEIIALKSELGILCDTEGKRLRDYKIENFNDELVITDEDENIFEYKVIEHNDIQPVIRKIPKDKTRIQKALFFEKKHLIENCLFGVDINNNSVMICRLRLWIELLKSAFYTEESSFVELETLPNIDINIKHGNSLISRYDLGVNLSKVFNKEGFRVKDYREAVSNYKESKSKDDKKKLNVYLENIKAQFKTEITNKELRKIHVLENEINQLNSSLFGIDKATKKIVDEKQKKLDKLLIQKQEIESSVIYKDAFEWRFEFPEVLDEKGDFIGFDCIIGNPPYIRQEEFKEIKSYLKENYPETFSATADIYVYFYEKGYQILNKKGLLCFISSNKWMRTEYGEKTRTFFSNKINPISIVDFGMVQIFDTATTYTNILIFQKTLNLRKTLSCRADNKFDGKIQLLSEYFNTNSVEITDYSATSWIVYDKKEYEIINKVKTQGLPLKNWKISIFRGVLTGFNEAFIIDSQKKDELISKDPKNAEIIKPILRGRDIKRYDPGFQDLWIIVTFPALKIDIDKYPTIREYLESFGKRLEQTGESYIDSEGNKISSRKKTGNKWFETQDQIAYYEEFEKPKIIYPNMTKYLPFVYDEEGFYTNQKCFIMTGNHLKYLVAILNSKLFKFSFKDSFPELLGNTYELSKVFFEQIPIKQVTEEIESEFNLIVDQILENKQQNIDTSDLEKQIDEMVYKLYDLTPEEIAIIEGK